MNTYHEQRREQARTWAETRIEEAQTELVAYVERRRAKGDTVEIVKGAYLTGPYTRAVLTINGTRRRMWNPYGTWQYA